MSSSTHTEDSTSPAHPEEGAARSGDPFQVWTLWYPKGAAQGLYFARGRMDAADAVLVHAATESLTVEIHDDDGTLLARGTDLPVTDDTPMTRLTVRGQEVLREDVWPGEEDLGRLVILPGGEVGVLLEWWNAEDQSEWRWRIEFYNHR